jgi:hypothetical protein
MEFPLRHPAAHDDTCAGGLIAEVTVVVPLRAPCAAGTAQRVLLAS